MEDIEDFSKENITNMHNTLLSFILIFLEKCENNSISITFDSEEIEALAKDVIEQKYTLNTLFEPITDEDNEVIGVELKMQRFNRTELLLRGLFGNETDIIM